jgi:tetratricopeptide (TPR) repeat protein
MWRMESTNIEDTHPNQSNSETNPEPDLEDTKPRRIRTSSEAGAEPAPSQPASASDEAKASSEALPATPPAAENPPPEVPAAQPEPGSPRTAFIDEDMMRAAVAPESLDVTRPITPAGEAHGFEDTTPTLVPPQEAALPPTVALPPAPAASAGPGQRSIPPTARPVKRRLPPSKTARKKRFRWLIYPAIGLLALILILAISGVGGYTSGISLRRSAEKTQVSLSADEQFQLGLQDMAEGNFFRARQRFEYVIQLNPNYPGAPDKLAEALLYLNATATSTGVPTPTITPTPDMRGIEDLFNQAQQAVLNSDWNAAMDALLALRQKDPSYRPVDIDGLLFLTLRNRGKDKIVHADLEGGIYDLTLAANFGPIDSEAQGLLNWAQLYITGASFWDLDWDQVIYYFSQVAPQMPNLMDGSGMTASERLRLGYFELGNSQAAQGQYCKAVQSYNQSLLIAPDPTVQAALSTAEKGCSGGGEGTSTTETPKPGKKKTPTPFVPPVP